MKKIVVVTAQEKGIRNHISINAFTMISFNEGPFLAVRLSKAMVVPINCYQCNK